MTNDPPNYRDVECCLNCQHAKTDWDWGIFCTLYKTAFSWKDGRVSPDHVCDSYK